MSSRRGENLDCKVYIGDLPRDANEQDLEKAFSYYGPLRSVWVARNPPGFAFVEFEDERDADDAIRGLDGTHIAGGRVRVELSTGKIRPKPWARRGGPPARGRMDDEKCYECGERGHYARDCRRGGGGGGRRSGGGARSRSRSRSKDRYKRDRSRDRSRSRSRSRDRSRSRSRGRDSRSKSRD